MSEKKPKIQEPELIRCAKLADALASALENVIIYAPQNCHQEMLTDLTQKHRNTIRDVRHIAKRLRRMQTVQENLGKENHFLVVDGDTLRPADPDEVLRLVMHYPPRGTSMLALLNSDNPLTVFREE